MIYELKEPTQENLTNVLEEIRRRNKLKKKTLADIYGKMKRGLDGIEYQKAARNGE